MKFRQRRCHRRVGPAHIGPPSRTTSRRSSAGRTSRSTTPFLPSWRRKRSTCPGCFAHRGTEREKTTSTPPMTREEYTAFYNALVSAEVVPERPFEKIPYFEGCMPIEVMAARGVDTLRFGPMKPVGLVDPRTNKRPYAVVQLRPESRSASLYNIVGFQTKLTYPEQRRVFRMIPGLEKTEFARLGSLHRNTFVCAPAILGETLQTKARGTLFLAGQITGVEGYVESAAMGWVAGVNAARLSLKEPLIVPPAATVIGSMVGHLTRSALESFQPMNAAFGLLPSLLQPVSDREARRNALIARARADMARWQAEAGVLPRLLGARTRERA